MFLLLPRLKRDSDVRASDEAGKWDAQDFDSFDKVASSLDYKAPGRFKSVSSVPTIWARPLSMSMALHNKDYPIRQQMIEQWQGMLAAIALAEVRSFPLSAQLLELGELRHQDPFARSLYELLPKPPVNALYTLNKKHPWQDVYIFLWDGRPVGMSSPDTIVVPSEEGRWEKLPWWDSRNRCLEAPQNYLNASEKALLWRWLENLLKELKNHQAQPKALEMMVKLLEDFRNSLGNYPQQSLILSDNPQFFGVPLSLGVLTALNLPVKAEPQPSCVRLIASESKKQKDKDLLIIDSEIPKAWHQSLQDIWVHEGKTLASLNIEDLKSQKILWNDICWIESKDLFLPEFAFINIEDALPGAFSPNSPLLVFNGQQITPLLPLNPILLDYFTPEDLMRRIQLAPLSGSEGPLVRITLDLPLSGMKNEEKNPQNYRISKDYVIKQENALTQVPVLQIWPNFRAEGWKEYYAFYYDQEVFTSSQPEDKTFQVELPEAKEPHKFQDGKGLYQITRLEEFPSFVTCKDKSLRNILGLILLKTPTPTILGGTWKVGVDFGTSFTNIYVNRKGVTQPLPLESLHLKVTEVDLETRIRVLTEFFVPESFIPLDKPLPLSSVLTTRQSNNLAKKRPIYDGRIYIPEKSFKPQEDWIETDLKWTNLDLNQLFLKHLALHITALAAKNGIKEIQWSLSYPSAFSRNDKTRYARNWKDLTKDLQAKTGITQICPEQDNLSYFRTESLATAQYFADSDEDHNLVNSTCIDMGGGTSDISIWQEGTDRFQLVHQCSLQLAGRHLFSQFLELNPKFLFEKFEVNPTELQGLGGGNFHAKLDVLLRLESEKWLDKIDYLEEDPDFQGFIRLMAIGTAGLYYYVGTILQVLFEERDENQERRYKTDRITPVYIGGNGSRLLNWLAVGGRFDRHSEINGLLSRMLSKASNFDDTHEITCLSTRPKDEVAFGLVLDETPLGGLTSKKAEPVIAGEDCTVNDEPIEWYQYLDLGEKNIKGFKIPKLNKVPEFLDEFNNAFTDLDIEGLTPMPTYGDSNYKDKLWREVHKELTTNLIKIKGDSENIRVEPPFILGLKALLRVLGKEWAGK